MVLDGIIEKAHHSAGDAISNTITREMKTDDLRLTINLNEVSMHAKYSHLT